MVVRCNSYTNEYRLWSMDRSHEAEARRCPDDYSALELRAIATRALALGGDYSRSLLRDQLQHEEFVETDHGSP